MDFKRKLMACTALLGAWLLLPAAGAQSASDAQKIKKLERQTELLQKQSELLQRLLGEALCAAALARDYALARD